MRSLSQISTPVIDALTFGDSDLREWAPSSLRYKITLENTPAGLLFRAEYRATKRSSFRLVYEYTFTAEPAAELPPSFDRPADMWDISRGVRRPIRQIFNAIVASNPLELARQSWKTPDWAVEPAALEPAAIEATPAPDDAVAFEELPEGTIFRASDGARFVKGSASPVTNCTSMAGGFGRTFGPGAIVAVVERGRELREVLRELRAIDAATDYLERAAGVDDRDEQVRIAVQMCGDYRISSRELWSAIDRAEASR